MTSPLLLNPTVLPEPRGPWDAGANDHGTNNNRAHQPPSRPWFERVSNAEYLPGAHPGRCRVPASPGVLHLSRPVPPIRARVKSTEGMKTLSSALAPICVDAQIGAPNPITHADTACVISAENLSGSALPPGPSIAAP